MASPTVILGIESSCDDTSASVIVDGVKYSNIIAGQEVHQKYGGVVPELASRAHQINIVPVVDLALKEAGVTVRDLSAVGYTRGPGLLGSLLVGSSFAKGLVTALGIPLIEVHHLQAHILAHFIREKDENNEVPGFPFLCLTVSGGHTQIVRVDDYFKMTVLGQTQDDAAGEAFDKIAKILGLDYPGGPLLDKLAQKGNYAAFEFPRARMRGLDFSFSGLKTSVLYFVQKKTAMDPGFIENNLHDIAASVQYTIVETLMSKLNRAVRETGIKTVAIAGGVSANSYLRSALKEKETSKGWKVFVPKMEYCMDNAAMIAITAYFKYLEGDFSNITATPSARLTF